MGKQPQYMYTDSETEGTSCSSIASENLKKRHRFSILKCNNSNVKKKKCKMHTKSEPEDSDYHSTRSHTTVKYKLPGILKHTEVRESSDEEDDMEPPPKPYNQSRYLVGRVPLPAGAKPGRGGGVAIVIKKNVNKLRSVSNAVPVPQISSTSTKKKRLWCRLLTKKNSF